MIKGQGNEGKCLHGKKAQKAVISEAVVCCLSCRGRVVAVRRGKANY